MDDRSGQAEAADPIRPGAAVHGATGSTRRRQFVLLTGTAIVLAVGLYFGYVLAYTASQGGLSAGLGALLLGYAIAAVIGLIAVFGVVAAAFRVSRRIGPGALAVAGLLTVGVLAGFTLTPVLGLGYREAATLEARGTASARLQGGAALSPMEPGYATCRSEPGSDTMTRIDLDLGRLPTGLLRGSVSISEAGPAEAWVELRVDASDDAEGAFQPEWLGTGEVAGLDERGMSGRVSFQTMFRTTESGTRGDAASDAWPATLSGSLSWACEPPLDPFATAPPARSGLVELHLDGVDWSPPLSGANATCDFEPQGSVAYVVANEVGRLQGLPVEVRLEGLSNPRGFLLSIHLSGKDPPPGQLYIPNWDGHIHRERDAAGNASGRVSFSDLDTGVDPDVTPPKGWPRSLTGSVGWNCEEGA